MRRDRVALLLAATVVLGGCSTSDRGTVEAKAPAGGVLLKGAGATFPSLLYQRWFTLYQDSHRGAAIAYDAVGSGEGIRRFTGTNVKPEEAVDFACKGEGPVTALQLLEALKADLVFWPERGIAGELPDDGFAGPEDRDGIPGPHFHAGEFLGPDGDGLAKEVAFA